MDTGMCHSRNLFTCQKRCKRVPVVPESVLLSQVLRWDIGGEVIFMVILSLRTVGAHFDLWLTNGSEFVHIGYTNLEIQDVPTGFFSF